MTVNKTQQHIRSDFEPQLALGDPVDGVLSANYHTMSAVDSFPLSSRPSQYNLDDYLSPVIMKRRDKLNLKSGNHLSTKDRFSTNGNDKIAQKYNTNPDELNEESWRYNRKWLSAVFMIWFFLAFALLLNAIYY